MNKKHWTGKHDVAWTTNGSSESTSESLVWLLLASIALAAVGLALAQIFGSLG